MDKKQIRNGKWQDPRQHPVLKKPFSYFFLFPFSHPSIGAGTVRAFFWVMIALVGVEILVRLATAGGT